MMRGVRGSRCGALHEVPPPYRDARHQSVWAWGRPAAGRQIDSGGACPMVRIALVPLATLLILPLMDPGPARAGDVDMALVLVTDVSRSIDDSEFKLEKDGYSSAFTNPKVLEAIQSGPTGRIAVSYLEFASSFEVRTVLDWTVIHDRASAQGFVERLTAAPRSFWG